MKKLKLGIIGLSKGNGHPYSWSAIFNGYNKTYMGKCPFTVIPKYLSKQNFPEDCIKNATVSHIWTQDKKMSENISKASKIKNIVNNYTDMIGQVDAILLARDDYENHYKISLPFIKAKIPIYIDKPIETSIKAAKQILDLKQYKNQIFTCSALSFAKEFDLSTKTLNSLGNIKLIEAYSPKDWDKYGVHIIEPVLKILDKQIGLNNLKINKINKFYINKVNQLSILWNNDLITNFYTLGNINNPIEIKIFGEKTIKHMIFKDTFYAFKKSLQTFINIINKKENCPSQEFTLNVIKIIEMGN